MILYVNGDSHTAAAEAVNQHAFAEDDGSFFYMGRAPHPSNLQVSWGKLLSEWTKSTFKCDAESASSNTRILRTTRAWLEQTPRAEQEALVIIQWSTWERQEWLIDDVYYQINASGIDDVPKSHQEQYKNFVANVDWESCRQQAHREIWEFHLELQDKNIQHVFFNGNNHFQGIAQQDWGSSYIAPYDAGMTYNQWLLNNGHSTVSPKSWHFGRQAHAAWGKFMLQYIISKKLI